LLLILLSRVKEKRGAYHRITVAITGEMAKAAAAIDANDIPASAVIAELSIRQDAKKGKTTHSM
jgi:hypothetical protein